MDTQGQLIAAIGVLFTALNGGYMKAIHYLATRISFLEGAHKAAVERIEGAHAAAILHMETRHDAEVRRLTEENAALEQGAREMTVAALDALKRFGAGQG